MSTKSYPVEDAAVSVAQWRSILDNGDGIINDYVGDAFGLVLSADKGTISPTGTARFRLNGQVLEVAPDASEFPFPPVTSDTTYQVAVRFDPANDKDPLGPLDLVSGVKGELTAPSGGTLVPLWEIPRKSGVALTSSSPRSDLRYWTGDVSIVQRDGYFPPGKSRGSLLWNTVRKELWSRVGSTEGWVSLSRGVRRGLSPIGNSSNPFRSGWNNTVGSFVYDYPDRVKVFLRFQRAGSTLPASSSGSITDSDGLIGTLSDHPVDQISGSGTMSTVAYGSQGAGTFGFNWTLSGTGAFVVTSLTNPGLVVAPGTRFACDLTIDL